MQVSLDLSAKRIRDLDQSGVDIVELLGQSFQGIIDFYKSVEGILEPRIMQALSGPSCCARVRRAARSPDLSERLSASGHVVAASLCERRPLAESKVDFETHLTCNFEIMDCSS